MVRDLPPRKVGNAQLVTRVAVGVATCFVATGPSPIACVRGPGTRASHSRPRRRSRWPTLAAKHTVCCSGVRRNASGAIKTNTNTRESAISNQSVADLTDAVDRVFPEDTEG